MLTISRDLNELQRPYPLPIPCYDAEHQRRVVAEAIATFPPTQELLAETLAIAVLRQPEGILWAGLLVEVLFKRLSEGAGPWSLGEELAWNFLIAELSNKFGFDNYGAEWWFQLAPGTDRPRVCANFHEHSEDVLALDLAELELRSLQHFRPEDVVAAVRRVVRGQERHRAGRPAAEIEEQSSRPPFDYRHGRHGGDSRTYGEGSSLGRSRSY